ncbi:leucine-rich repeat transmembrane neuronal protein 2-like [Wyeomyia smithii]|uniref:leucine-rich repeat transmembrane neuronal protein 2-like n=1 Tax=Wyeomyia smithii TaxID=174621 RepID=UPI002468168E|nr:leucine-rich repeat transmembrane neuronal protein 2-like [Wyeomyia smithii]
MYTLAVAVSRKMWFKVALLFGVCLTAAAAQKIKTLDLSCSAVAKATRCLLNNVNVQEKEIINPTANPSTETELWIENSQLTYFPDVLFTRFPKMETLVAKKVGLKKLLSNTFSKAPNLKHLDLSSNAVGLLPNDVFGPCQQFETINIAENRLHTLNGVALMGCNRLRQVNASFNQLIYINWDPLNDLRLLEQVDVSNNWITEITVPKYVRKLKAHNNHIHQLKADRDSFVFMLEYLDISRNRLSSVDVLVRFVKLTYINLSHNRLLSIDFALFKNMRSLQEIRLAHNNIFAVSTTELKPNSLKFVDLSNNELTRLAANDSAGFGSVEKLLLNNNYLVSFEVSNGSTNFPNLREVFLGNNDWACRDIEVALEEFKAKNVVVNLGSKQCTPYQVLKRGICCRDLGTSFDELVLLKAEKLTELHPSSTTARATQTSTSKPIAQKIQMTSLSLSPAGQPSNENLETLRQALKEAETRLAAAQSQLTAVNNEKLALKMSLDKAKNEAALIGEKLARCKSTFSQRTSQAVLID